MGVKEASAKCQITGEVEPGGDGVPVGFKRSEVGTIPQDWNEISLISLAGGSKDRFDDGDWIEAEYLTDGGIRLIQTGNIGIGRFIDKEARKYISNQSFEKLRCKDVFEGDLLVCRLAEPAGRACIVPRLDEARAITAVDVTIFRPVPEVAENRFLLHYFGTNQWLSAVNERCGGSTRSRIARGNLGGMLVPLPSDRAEQKAVADALSDADALIESLQQLIAKKRALKQGVMQVLLTGKQRLPGFSCKWVEVSLGDIAEVVMGQSPSSSHYNMKGVGLPLIQGNADVHGRTTIKRVFTDQITKLGRAGDVLMSVRAPVGRISRTEFDVCLGRGVCAIRYPNDFVFHALVWNENDWSSLSKGSTFDSVNSADVKSLSIKLPKDPEEQVAVAAVLSDMDAEIDALEARLVKARDLKAGMMQALLTGRIRLPLDQAA